MLVDRSPLVSTWWFAPSPSPEHAKDSSSSDSQDDDDDDDASGFEYDNEMMTSQ